MPFTKTDYSKTIIYKICCNDLNIRDIYIGSTTNFRARKYKHKSLCNSIKSKEYNYKLYQLIRENGNWENWSMVEIEKYPCNDNNEARARERYWYEQLKPSLNIFKPLQTQEERNEYCKEYNKKYKDEHVEYYLEYIKEYREKTKTFRNEKIHCSCGSIISRNSKSKHDKSFNHISKTQSLFTS
jgi:hypothetical protein